MKDILEMGLCMLFILLMMFFTTDIINDITNNDKDEYIKILEQSLNEQIQEKEVYMKMVERSNNE